MVSHVYATLGFPYDPESDSDVELEIVESTDTSLKVRLPKNPYPPFSVNSIPYCFSNWKIGIDRYAPNETVDVFDKVDIADDVATLNVPLDMDSQSYLAIVYFMDSDGVPYPSESDDGTAHPLAPLLITSLTGNVTAPLLVAGDDRYPQEPSEPLMDDEEYIFAGWGDAGTGAIYGAGSPIPVKLRTFMALKPIWTVGFKDKRYATAMFDASSHGSFKDSNGDVLDGWNITDDAYDVRFDTGYSSAHVVMGISTFTIPSGLTFVPDAEGDWSIPRFISSWVRVDGGELVDPLNDTNKGFFLSDEVSGKVFAGDHYGDIYYPGDTLTLREGESARLVPIWAYAYTYRITYDLTQFTEIIESAKASGEVDEEELLSELRYWMKKYDITPLYDNTGAFAYKGYHEEVCAKRVLWTRIPSSMPPCATYFKKWITYEKMLDISTKFVHGNYVDSLTYLPPCPGQRVGLQIERGYYYDCTLKAEWCSVGSSIPSASVVYDDPDWVEPSNVEGIDERTLVDMPHSMMVEGVMYPDADKPSEIILDFRVRLAGTGKDISPDSATKVIDTRPKGNGLYSLVKSFVDWNVRFNEDGTAQSFLAGDALRIIVSGNVMASYYWGEFPGPYSQLSSPAQISRAWKYFKSASGKESKEPVLWGDVINKKAIWGPQLTETDEDDPNLHTIEAREYPEVIFAEASWRTQTGAYLIFGDYSKIGSANNTGYVPTLALPHIQSISDTLSNTLSEVSTVAYGYENRFIMDLGSTRKIEVKLARINPPDYYDGYSEADDPTEYYDDEGNLLTGDMHPSKKNKFFYADHWSNSKWYAMLREEMNFWQNSLHASNKSVYGGVQLYYSTPPLNSIEVDAQTVANLSASRPFYPNMLYNVFMTGSISPSFDGQKMTVSLPLTLSKMITSGEATGSQETTNNWCVLYPYPEDYKIGEMVKDSVQEGVNYIDSFNATRLIRTVSRTSSDTWLFTAPTAVDEWSASRAYYEEGSSEPYQTNVPLSIVSWELQWYDNGATRTATLNAGSQIDLGKASSVALVAQWAGTIETVIVSAQDGFVYRENYMKGNSSRYFNKSYDTSKGMAFTIPEYATRMTVQMCGGGGAGGKSDKEDRKKWGFGGGGGAGGQRIVSDVILNSSTKSVLVYAGRGGRTVSEDNTNGESSFVREISTSIDETSIDPSSVQRYGCSGANVIALGGPCGTLTAGGRYEADVTGVANGGNPATTTDMQGSSGESLGEFNGGTGGSVREYVRNLYGGGGGGGACGFFAKLLVLTPYVEDLQVKYHYVLTSFKSVAGDGFSMTSDSNDVAEDGAYGGGGGGGQASIGLGGVGWTKGGSGIVMIQFFGGGS